MLDEILPREMLEQFVAMQREFVASGREPAVPRSAATVVMLRPDRSIFLMRRSRGMAFGGMWAFPGGGLEQDETPVQAAVREVFEETGVCLEPGQLHPWHRWLTPVFEPRRFDAWFYLASVPADVEPHLPPGEADQIKWLTPEEGIAANASGDMPMLPPTMITLAELSAYSTVDEMLAVARDVSSPYMPGF